jgi:hypothetical protein
MLFDSKGQISTILFVLGTQPPPVVTRTRTMTTRTTRTMRTTKKTETTKTATIRGVHMAIDWGMVYLGLMYLKRPTMSISMITGQCFSVLLHHNRMKTGLLR